MMTQGRSLSLCGVEKIIMNSSSRLVVLSVLPCLLTLAACAGNVSNASLEDESPSASREEQLNFRLGTTAKVGPVITSTLIRPRVSDVIDVRRPVQRFTTTVVIDDFTTGQDPINLSDWDVVSYQSGPKANIIGGNRRSSLKVMSESPTVLGIPTGGPMLIDAAPGSFWSVDLRYGFAEDGAHPLDLATGSYTRFRLNFEALDADVDYSISVVDGNGNAAYSEGIRTTSSSPSPFFADFPFSSLHAPAGFNWDDIDAVNLSFYTVSLEGGNDVTLRSIIVQ